jgi:hypothetical protein
VKVAGPRCRTLTAARLDRDADLDRDYAAVATALCHDAGVPADHAIARGVRDLPAGRDCAGPAAAA